MVFVESFEEKYIDKTKYSLSTKVPEYLSLKKPILAIGPKNVGSMKYLKDVAQCVHDISDLEEKIEELLFNPKLVSSLKKKSEEKYLKNHNNEINIKKFYDILFEKDTN